MANHHDKMLSEAVKHGRLACKLATVDGLPAELAGRAAKIAARCAFLAKPWLRAVGD